AGALRRARDYRFQDVPAPGTAGLRLLDAGEDAHPGRPTRAHSRRYGRGTDVVALIDDQLDFDSPDNGLVQEAVASPGDRTRAGPIWAVERLFCAAWRHSDRAVLQHAQSIVP